MLVLCFILTLRTAVSVSSVNFSDTLLPPLESLQVEARGPGSQCQCWSGFQEPELESDCRCSGDHLLDIPTNISANVRRLTVAEAGMTRLSAGALQPFYYTLTDFSMTDVRQLEVIEVGVFSNLTLLQTIYIHRAPLLIHLHPDLFAVQLRSLKILRIVHTGLVRVPALDRLYTSAPLHMVDFENNQIREINSKEVQLEADHLLLNHNVLERLHSHAFNSSQIAKLSMKGNRRLSWLHEDCFLGLSSLRHLDLSETAISNLPTKGLQGLDVLRMEHTPTLKAFPSVYNFKHIREVYLTYPYHCCAFHFPATHDPQEYAKHQSNHLRLMMALHSEAGISLNVNTKFLDELRSSCSWEQDRNRNSSESGVGSELSLPDFLLQASVGPVGLFHDGVTVQPGRRVQALCGNLSKDYGEVLCHPAPDAFNPCEDLMGNWALRVAVWIVAVAAVLGNATVLLVLGSSRFRMTVPKFLMCHLAVADFCMGLYLLIIAVVDSRSIGDYFNHAIDWQNGIGCKVAGSLTVFARELSIFTLTLITIERWYTITYAIHLDKRLNLSRAGRIMVFGWLYALVMAACPLLGVSGYSKTSICLPLENLKAADLAYLIVLLAFNGAAFWLVCACYGCMYCAIRGGPDSVAAPSRSDLTVAKRMALLVFTDFACWAPIAFFGITALAGYPLIDVSKTKILLVFFYPLNSCANPYLYALLTQQYRRDLLALLSRCGLCPDAAARYKGPQAGARGRRGGPVFPCPPPPNHRGSVLTTVTSLEPITPNSHRSRQVELLPLSLSVPPNTHSTTLHRPVAYF